MNDGELHELLQVVGSDGSLQGEDIPPVHREAFGLFVTAVTWTMSPSGGGQCDGRHWRRYVDFLRHTRLGPGAVTQEAVNAWYSRR